MLEAIPEVFPDARYQRCIVHFYRNIFSVTPHNKMKTVEGNPCTGKLGNCREKTVQVVEKLRTMKLAKAAKKVEDGIEETLTLSPSGSWHCLVYSHSIPVIGKDGKPVIDPKTRKHPFTGTP